MIPTRDILAFGAADTTKTFTFSESGFIKSIIMVLPNFTTAASVTQIDFYDDEGNNYYTNSTGWNDNATRLISSLSIPVHYSYSMKVTLNDVAGGAHNAVIKAHINTKE